MSLYNDLPSDVSLVTSISTWRESIRANCPALAHRRHHRPEVVEAEQLEHRVLRGPRVPECIVQQLLSGAGGAAWWGEPSHRRPHERTAAVPEGLAP